MSNERLRAALLERGITPAVVGGELGVDQKTVERWLAGRLPYRKYRFALAARLSLDEVYLWPDALPNEVVGAASEAEILAVYPHRWQAPPDAWRQLFTAAEREIGILVYDEGIDAAVAAKIRNVLVLYRALRGIEGAEFRFHQTILYNSIYRADDQLLVNTHVQGIEAARAPLWHLRKIAGGELAAVYLESFERVWEAAVPVPGD